MAQSGGYKTGLRVGVWLSLVEHLVRDEGVAGSNPATPTNISRCFSRVVFSLRNEMRNERVNLRSRPPAEGPGCLRLEVSMVMAVRLLQEFDRHSQEARGIPQIRAAPWGQQCEADRPITPHNFDLPI